MGIKIPGLALARQAEKLNFSQLGKFGVRVTQRVSKVGSKAESKPTVFMDYVSKRLWSKPAGGVLLASDWKADQEKHQVPSVGHYLVCRKRREPALRVWLRQA